MAVECSPCGLKFTSVSAFDEHLTEGGAGPHLDPATVPTLFWRDSGVWGGKPMSDEAKAALRSTAPRRAA